MEIVVAIVLLVVYIWCYKEVRLNVTNEFELHRRNRKISNEESKRDWVNESRSYP